MAGLLQHLTSLAPQKASGAATRGEEEEHAKVLRATALALQRTAWLAEVPGDPHAHGRAVSAVVETLDAQLQSIDALEAAAMAGDSAGDSTGERGAQALTEAAAAAGASAEVKQALTAKARKF